MDSRETTAASIPVKSSFTSFKGTATTKAGRFWGATARGSLRNLTTCSCFDCRQVTNGPRRALPPDGTRAPQGKFRAREEPFGAGAERAGLGHRLVETPVRGVTISAAHLAAD